jgi:hypothetical protein
MEYFFEVCVDDDLKVWKMTDIVESNTAPFYDGEIIDRVDMLSNEKQTFVLPNIVDSEGNSETSETILVQDLVLGTEYDIAASSLEDPITLKKRTVTIDPKSTEYTQVYNIKITLGEENSDYLQSVYDVVVQIEPADRGDTD